MGIDDRDVPQTADVFVDRIRPAKYTVDGGWEERIGYFSLLAA